MKRGKYNLCLLVISFFAISNIQAQVTIGSDEQPDPNALLDLKEQNDGTSQKGLLLPRVALTSTSSALPMSGHVQGLTVYNTATTADLTPGFYCNDGSKWVKVDAVEPWMVSGTTDIATSNTQNIYQLGNVGIGTKNPQNVFHVDGAKDNADTPTPVQLSNDFFITSNGNVGIGTNNPANKLEVNGSTQIEGKTYLKSVANAPADNVSQLVADDSTGEIYAVRANSNNKAFTYLTYQIQCSGANSGADWINGVDISIPKDLYTVVVVGSTFQTSNGNGVMRVYPTVFNGDFAVFSVYATAGDTTWRLYADFIGGAPADLRAGTWIIHCLVLNKSLINVKEDPITHTMTSTTGPAIPMPTEL